ncbi:MAG: Ig-like domain-containing protein [Peptococcaceae bacterium]|nr:Ig-like domain-containing protein [Peptococcaceae bacterium]
MQRPNKYGIGTLIILVLLVTFVSVTLAVDSPGLTLTAIYPTDSAVLSTTNFGVSFTVTDTDYAIQDANYFIKLDGKVLTSKLSYPGHWEDNPDTESYDWVIDTYKQATVSAGVTGATDGTHTLEVQAMDSSGIKITKTWSFTVAVKPTFANPIPADGATTADNSGFAVKVADNDAINPDSITAQLDDKPVVTTFDTISGIVAYKATLPDGNHKAKVAVSDAAGNSAAKEWSFTVSTTGPVLSFTNSTTQQTANFTLSFKVTDQYSGIKNSGYYVKLDGVNIPANMAYPGHWVDNPTTESYYWVTDTDKEATISAAVSGAQDGEHSVEVQAVDKVGTTALKTWNFPVAVKPVFANSTPAAGTATRNNTGFSVKVTDNSAINPASIEAQLDGHSVATTFDVTTGLVAYKATIPDGTHTARVVAADTAGNTASQEWSFTVQTTGPTLSFAGNGQTFATAQPTFLIDMQSNVDLSNSVTVLIDNTQAPATFNYLGHTKSDPDGDYYVIDSYKQGTISCNAPVLRDGSHQLTVTANDKLGNSSTATWQFSVNQPPSFSAISPADGAVISARPIIKATVNDNDSVDPNSVSLLIDAVQVTPQLLAVNDSTVTVTFSADNLNNDTTHTVKLAASDTAGNKASTTWKFFAAAIGQQSGFIQQTPTDQSSVTTDKPVLSVHFSDLSHAYATADASMTIDSGASIQPTVTGKDTEFLISYTPLSLGDGKHTINVSVPSLAGAPPATTSWSFNVNCPPVITQTAPTSVVTTSTPELEAYASDNSALAGGTFSLDGQTLDAVLDTHFNRLAVKVPSALADGSHNVSLTVLDAAGNATTSKWSFSVDTNIGQIYPNMQVTTNTTCWSCHTQEYKLQHVAPNQCLQCHASNFTSIASNAQVFQDCIGCHYNNAYINGRHAWDRTWVWSNLPNDRHAVNDEHLSTTTECTQCHSRILTEEHNRPENKDKNGNPITCDTCHGETYLATVSGDEATKVKAAIAGKATNCDACHTQTDHASLHDSQFDSKCTGSGCHSANIETEHLNNFTTSNKGYTCNTCHGSSNNTVLSAIRNGQVTCNNCHTTAHKVPLTGNLPPDIPQFQGLTFSQPIAANIFAGDPGLPLDYVTSYKSGSVVLSSRSNVNPSNVWDFYNTELAKDGWKLNSPAPGASPTYFAVEFKRDNRLLTVRCYKTVFGDNTGDQTSGYRVDIWYN